MNDFEELAHRSSDALRSAVDTDPIPDFRGPANRTPAVIAALVLIAALVGGGVWLNVRDDDDVRTDRAQEGEEVGDDETGAADAVGSAEDLSDHVDDDFRLEWPNNATELVSAGVIDWGESGVADLPVARTTLYGRGSESVPYAESDLLIATFETGNGVDDEFSGEEIQVRGGAGRRDNGLAELGFPEAVTFKEGENLAVVVASRTLPFEQLVEIAEGLTFDGIHASTAVSSLEPLAAIDALPVSPTVWADGVWQLTYQGSSGDAEGRVGGVSISAAPVDEQYDLVQRYMFEPEAIELRGTTGWQVTEGSSDGLVAPQIFWREAGHLVSVWTTDLDAIEVAEELVVISAQEFDELEVVSSVVGVDSGCDQVGCTVLLGKDPGTTDSARIRLTAEPDGSLCLSVSDTFTDATRSSTACGPAEQLPMFGASTGDNPEMMLRVTEPIPALGLRLADDIDDVVHEPVAGGDSLVSIIRGSNESEQHLVLYGAELRAGDRLVFFADGAEVGDVVVP